MRTVYVVIDKLLTEEDSWETNLTSLLQGYVDAAQITDFQIEDVREFDKVKPSFEKKVIKPKDIFIFTNAWTTSIQYIKHWSEFYKVPVTMLGFWSKGCFINSDPDFRPLNDRSWRKLHETTNMKCLDKSFFLNDWYKNQFQDEISRGSNPDKLQVCKFPLDYLSLELSLIKDSYYKQNMVIFPWSNYNSLHEQIVYDFIRVFKKSKIIFAQENSPMQRIPLMHQMSKAKVAFLPYTYPNIGQEIYECFLLETIPVVPDIDGFKELVPKEFRYPPEWTDSIFNYCKFAPDLTGKIQTMLDSYEELKPLLLQHQERLTEHYFDSEQIIKEIFA